MSDADTLARQAAQAAVYRRLIAHFQERSDVQNIDVMELAGFCRNCLSKWYREAAQEQGLSMELEDARQEVYGMPYSEWKARFQR